MKHLRIKRRPRQAGDRMVILVNTNLKMSRGKMAAQAIHAALMLTGRHHGGPVVVLGAKPADIEAAQVRVRDAGRTEVEPGSLTAGASWAPDDGNRVAAAHAANSRPTVDPTARKATMP